MTVTWPDRWVRAGSERERVTGCARAGTELGRCWAGSGSPFLFIFLTLFFFLKAETFITFQNSSKWIQKKL